MMGFAPVSGFLLVLVALIGCVSVEAYPLPVDMSKPIYDEDMGNDDSEVDQLGAWIIFQLRNPAAGEDVQLPLQGKNNSEIKNAIIVFAENPGDIILDYPNYGQDM